MFIVYSQIMKGFKLRPSLSKETFQEFFRNFSGIFPEKFRDFTFPEKLQPYMLAYSSTYVILATVERDLK